MAIVGSRRWWAMLFLLLGLGLGGTAPARAAPATGLLPISACIAPARAGDQPLALVTGRRALNCAENPRRLGAGDFWALSQPLAVRGPVLVRAASVWQAGATLYALYADGAVRRIALDPRALSRRIDLGAVVAVPLPDRAVPLARLLWRIEGAANLRGVLVGAEIATPAADHRAQLTMAAVYAAFAGLCLALLIYNLALWGALRHRFLLVYGVMAVALLCYTLSSSGLLAWIVPGLDNNDRLRINDLTLGWAGCMMLAFARSFFGEAIFHGWLRRLSHAVNLYIAVVSVAYAALAPWWMTVLDTAYTLGFAMLAAIAPLVMWRAWRQRSRYLTLFAIAWGLPIALGLGRTATALHLIPGSFWLDHSTLIAMAAEALLASLAIALRIRLLTRERDDALARELAAMRLADTDPLTGLLNRRAFLRQAIGRTGEQSLLIADLDHFKRVNDTIGHDGGDEVLRVFARLLRQVTASPDALVARIGGEEFVVLSPRGSAVAADRVLAGLRAARMPFDLSVTASIGVCAGPMTSESDWKWLYRGADRALFEAKSAGRDRARTAPLGPRIAA